MNLRTSRIVSHPGDARAYWAANTSHSLFSSSTNGCCVVTSENPSDCGNKADIESNTSHTSPLKRLSNSPTKTVIILSKRRPVVCLQPHSLVSISSATAFKWRSNVELCDECKDVGKDEQLSVCIRFLSEGTLDEGFYNFVKAEGQDARSVLQKLRDVLSEMEVDPAAHLVAQCYDGANVMAGRLNGLQALMRQEVCPIAIYMHCWAHRLNLVVISTVQGIDKASSFFTNMATPRFLLRKHPPRLFRCHTKDMG